ncbi:MAG: hypothetical protein JWQ25_26 [Daejeonella sp.]|nr:hypothetical protein [Daejeonella sp.]
MDKLSKIKELIASAQSDAEKFYTAGNGAAGTRLRKTMQDLKTLASDVRKEVTEIKNKKD